MEDYSHLSGVDRNAEKQTLINSEGHNPESAKALLTRMKYISDLIAKVNFLLPIDL